ncbi:MAG: hypothetical protein PGN12_07375 [Sphingomonas phyllosphaerae]
MSEARQVRSDLSVVCMGLTEEAIPGGAHPVAVTGHYVAMPRKLKVFRTSTGFHDAYVAAPSRKAALEAWGADVDLFARGAAEEVSDPGLMEEALARPGEIVRKVRGTMEEHFAAMPDEPTRSNKDDDAEPAKRKPAAKAKPVPRPSRSKLDEAEHAFQAEEARYEAARRDLMDSEASLRAERQALDAKHERERRQLEDARSEQEAKYKRAVERWQAN